MDDVQHGQGYDDLDCDAECGISSENEPTSSSPELCDEDTEIEVISTQPSPPELSIQLAIPQRLYSGVDSYLLDYYIQKVCPQCSLSADLNPYLSIILPVASGFTPLRDLLLATSACQLRLWNDNRFATQAISLKNRALRGLRQHLAIMPVDWTSLLTILMFCFHDVSTPTLRHLRLSFKLTCDQVLDNCAASWTTHLAMGMDMFDRLAKGRAPTDDGIESFCELWLVVHDVMRSTTWQYGRSRKQLAWSKKDPLEVSYTGIMKYEGHC